MEKSSLGRLYEGLQGGSNSISKDQDHAQCLCQTEGPPCSGCVLAHVFLQTPDSPRVVKREAILLKSYH